MKLLYILIFIFGVILGGYLLLNNFSFDNKSFSDYLINTLFIFLLSCVGIGILIMTLISIKRRSHKRGIMTIREYYEYKAR
jgi:hypothetical protein